jgi:hypothetical protein
MRFVLAAAIFVTAMAVDLRPAPARSMRHVTPWCVIVNTGRAEWTCYPTRALCHRLGERPGSMEYCVEYPVWSGRG